MPHTDSQWGWFLFYTGGAAFAWMWAVTQCLDLVKTIQIARSRRRR